MLLDIPNWLMLLLQNAERTNWSTLDEYDRDDRPCRVEGNIPGLCFLSFWSAIEVQVEVSLSTAEYRMYFSTSVDDSYSDEIIDSLWISWDSGYQGFMEEFDRIKTGLGDLWDGKYINKSEQE